MGLASKSLLGTLLIVSTTIAIEGCKDGDDDADPGPSAGMAQAGKGGGAGASGSSGRGGRSGAGGSAGKAGSGGKGGGAGTGGVATGGGAGQAGEAGAGDGAGAAGTPAGGAGNEGGEGGAAGSGEAASLDGATVHLEGRSPRNRPISERLAATVGPGVEFANFEEHPLSGFYLADVDVDVSGQTIELVYDTTLVIPAATFNGYVIELSDLGGSVIHSVTVDPTSSATLLDAEVTLTGSTIDVNVASLSVSPGDKLVLSVDL